MKQVVIIKKTDHTVNGNKNIYHNLALCDSRCCTYSTLVHYSALRVDDRYPVPPDHSASVLCTGHVLRAQ